MIILESKKVIFFKTFKTAGTAIEMSLTNSLQENDVQVSFGYGKEKREGINEKQLALGLKEIIVGISNNPLQCLKVAYRYIFLKENPINEHTDPEILMLFFPKYIEYKKLAVYREHNIVNESNYRMHKRRYGYSGSLDSFLKEYGEISNKLFYQDRKGRKYEHMVKFDYSELNEITSYFAKLDIKIDLSTRVNG